MAGDAIDYGAVIADLENRRATVNAAFDQAINAIRQVVALTSPASGVVPTMAIGSAVTMVSAGPANSMELTPDAFFGLSLAEAAKKYLRAKRSALSNKDIAEGLEAAGFRHTSKDFANTVGTALWRAEQAEGDVFRQGRQWLLSEWYPNRRRKKDNGENEPKTDADSDANVEDEPNEQA